MISFRPCFTKFIQTRVANHHDPPEDADGILDLRINHNSKSHSTMKASFVLGSCCSAVKPISAVETPPIVVAMLIQDKNVRSLAATTAQNLSNGEQYPKARYACLEPSPAYVYPRHPIINHALVTQRLASLKQLRQQKH